MDFGFQNCLFIFIHSKDKMLQQLVMYFNFKKIILLNSRFMDISLSYSSVRDWSKD